MEGAWVAILVIAALAAGVALVWLGWQAEKKRRLELAALAGRLGWSFDPGHNRHHDEAYAQFEIFRRGHSRAAYNTLQGSLEVNGGSWPAKMGDFTYKVTRYSGKTVQTTTYRFSYLVVHLPSGVPGLLIRPENFFDKIAGALGFDDIDFESAEFSRRFHVKSTDKRFAYDILHPKMMEFLMVGTAPAVHIELGTCCVSDGQRQWQTADFFARLEWLREFFALWPRHLEGALT